MGKIYDISRGRIFRNLGKINLPKVDGVSQTSDVRSVTINEKTIISLISVCLASLLTKPLQVILSFSLESKEVNRDRFKAHQTSTEERELLLENHQIFCMRSPLLSSTWFCVRLRVRFNMSTERELQLQTYHHSPK